MAKRKTSSKTANEKSSFKDLNQFLTSKVAERATSGMSNGAKIALFLDKEAFYFTREAGKNVCKTGECDDPEMSFWLTNDAAQKVFNLTIEEDASITDIGLSLFDSILSKDEKNKIRFSIHASFLRLWSKGYFSVLKTGGPEIAAYMARIGFGSLQQLKKLFMKS